MRIQKILSDLGVTSRRMAEAWMLAGRVTVNGRICNPGDRADPDTDDIRVDGKPIPKAAGRLYILLNKPRGYVCTLSDERGRRTVAELVADCGQRVYPCGRLDYDSEGLLLMTNDGDFAQTLMHPKHEVDKTYAVTVTGYSPQALKKLKLPITLDGYTIRAPQVRLIREGEKTLLEVTIHEGRNRQVRRMCAIAGMEVVRLKRIKEGKLELGSLPCGKWRLLTDQEVDMLK